MNETILNLESISYSYKQTGWKLDSVDLSVNAGEFIGILGANGSGKSTLLKIAAGILDPAAGNVILQGRSLRKIPRRQLAQSIGYLPQQVNSAFNLKVKEIVSMGRFCHSKGLGIVSAVDEKIVDECMRETETFDFRDRSIDELSGGERQRVFLASVLAQQPRIMLLDEPGTGLDMHHQVSFFKLLAQLNKKEIAVVVITHELNLASQFCGKVLLLSKGKKEIFGSVEKVFERIGQIEMYSKDMSFIKHPSNHKPAVLPYNNSLEDSI
ncbi:MAG: ABC transporter ATP-binding protein [Phycisphaerae bacterium]|nr:ABC transporter ATP-binding protein [Phycisphaerae bacterium]